MNPGEAKKRIDWLRKEIERHNQLYYVLAKPEVSDFEFDAMLRDLEALEAKYPQFFDSSSPTQRVGSDLTSGFVQVEHKYFMPSLANTYSFQELDEFDARVRKIIPQGVEYVCELKYDGTAISITYTNGMLKRAVTRGDGTRGDDVSANVKTIQSIPLKLLGADFPQEFEIRGEIVMSHAVFDELNRLRTQQGESPFANPRNAAAGTLKLLDASIVASRKLECFFFFVMGEELPFGSHYVSLERAREWGFNVTREARLCSNIDEVKQFIAHWDEARKEFPFGTDGVVVKVNDYGHQKLLGYTSKTPRWAIAYKYKAERVATRLLSVDFQVGRTGAVTPVANLQPVQLAGTTVKRASLHNLDQIELLNLHLNDAVWVEKGGEIIPKIVGVDESERLPQSQMVTFVTQCPECGTPLSRPEGEAKHYCPNTYGCPPQIKGRILHFIGRKAMDVDGLGEETVELLYNVGLVKDPADLYSLTYNQIIDLDGFAEKSTRNAINSIAKSKEIPLHRLIFALGIRYVGETTATSLAKHFGTLEALRKAQFDELVQVEEVGERIASSIVNFFENPVNIQILDKLASLGVKAQPVGVTNLVSGKLKGENVVISGTFSRISRDEAKTLIVQHGGKVLSSVTGSTTLLVAGENMGPAKLEKAQKLGIRIISEHDFINLIVS